MRLLLKSLVALAAVVAMSQSIAATPLTEISGNDPGHVQFPVSEAAVAFRPRSADQKSLTIDNYYIHDLINQKGLDIRASLQDNAPAWAYRNITVENSRFEDINRREDLPGGAGLHIDHIRIAGGAGNAQDTKINILIQNVVINGGDALPILITDGNYGTVTLRNVTIKNTTLNNVQFKTDKVGSVDKIIIDDCPDLGVALIGRPGSIGEVLVRNSEGIRLGDSLNAAGRSGASISFIDAASAQESLDAAVPASLHLTPAIPGGQTFTSSGSIPSSIVFPEPSTALIFLAACGLAAQRRRPR
jgi:hypothetical protein